MAPWRNYVNVAVGGIGVDRDRNNWGRGVGRKCLGSQRCDGGDNCIWIVGTCLLRDVKFLRSSIWAAKYRIVETRKRASEERCLGFIPGIS